MDTERLRTFMEIVRGGSFQEAAKKLNVTQTTVSARIRTLEAELDQRLFVRNRSGARLTAAGREFSHYARTLLQVWERARHHLALPAGCDSIVAIGAELSLWNPLLVDTIVHLKQTNPTLAVRSFVALADRLMDQVHSGVLDLAVVYSPRIEKGIQIELLLEENLVLVRSTAVPRNTSAEDDFVYVDWGSQFEERLTVDFMKQNQPSRVFGFGPVARGYIIKAGGRGYFRKGIVAPFIEAGELELVPDSPEYEYPAYVVYSDEVDKRTIEPALEALRTVAKVDPFRPMSTE